MATQSVLIVDDEPDIRELLDITLSRMGLQTHSAANLGEAMTMVAELKPDLCLTDMRLPDGNGISLVEHIQQEFSHIPVAMITAHGSVETAISALKAGAFDFVSKPIELDNLRKLVSSALQLEGDPSRTQSAVDQDLIGSAPAIQTLRKQISKLARSQAPVHIHGESGSGKEVVARLIHNNGPRAAGAFVAVNCGAIPPELMESELFGHMKGSFTGASTDKIGLFQAASGGTLFLDEVADLPLAMQVKLLRAIQEKAIRPIGGHAEFPIDARILSATHKDLAAEVDAERFRGDLYYRINVIPLSVPSLRQRRGDIPLLAEHFLTQLAERWQIAQPVLSDAALEQLKHYPFPGNIRELENILERALTLCEGNAIQAADLQLDNQGHTDIGAVTAAADKTPLAPAIDTSQPVDSLESFLETIEKDVISKALERCRWNKTETAKSLGITFRALRYRLKKLQLE